MGEHLVDCILPHRMFDVVLLGLVIPLGIEFMHLHRHFFQLFHVESFVNLAEATPAQQTQQLVAFYQRPILG